MLARVIESSAANGSSSRSTSFSAISVRRNATRWRIPPESWAGMCSSNSASPKRSKSGRARSRASRRDAPRFSSARQALSSALRQGRSRSFCGIRAQRARRSRAVVADPIVIDPAFGSIRPAMSESSVDFPQPLGPTIPRRVCIGMCRSIPSSATVSPKTWRTPWIAIEELKPDRGRAVRGALSVHPYPLRRARASSG